MQPQNLNIQYFLEEINNHENIDDEEKLCLIHSTPLTKNYVTLHCNHSFNYVPLVDAIIHQKSTNFLNVLKLAKYQIQCPYCRTIHNKLLPFIPNEKHPIPIKNVNSPETLCMTYSPCRWSFKSGKNKNDLCLKNGYEGEKGVFCKTHHKMMEKKEVLLEWNSSMNKYKKFTILQLKDILHEKNLRKTGSKHTLIRRIATSE